MREKTVGDMDQASGFKLAISGREGQVNLTSGESVLHSGLRQGVRMPHLCLAGECGSCKCRLLKGRLRLRRDISAHVDADALRSGYVLACQSEALSDVTLAVPGISPDSEQPVRSGLAGRIRAATPLAPNVLHLTVSLATPVSYEAGQYAQLRVPGQPGLKDVVRCYSFCSAPRPGGQTEVDFHVRHVPGGAFTDWLFAASRVGSELELQAPYGAMRVRENGRPVVCVAGGTGLAPIKAMLEAMVARRYQPDLTLFIAARTQADLYGWAELKALQAAWKGTGRLLLVPVLSAEAQGSGWSGLRGHCVDQLEQYCDPASTDFYLCGSPGLVDAAIGALRCRVSQAQLHYDRFLDQGTLAAATMKEFS